MILLLSRLEVVDESVAGAGRATGAASEALNTGEAMDRANEEQRRPILWTRCQWRIMMLMVCLGEELTVSPRRSAC